MTRYVCSNLYLQSIFINMQQIVRPRAWLRITHLGEALCQRRSIGSTASQSSSTGNQIIFSAIQPTGIPHLGNYLGALREWVHLQNTRAESSKLFFSIADLHSLTVPQAAPQLHERRKQTFAMLLAVGLDPAHCTLFYQSAVCFYLFIYLFIYFFFFFLILAYIPLISIFN